MLKLKILTLVVSTLFFISCNGSSNSVSKKDAEDAVMKLLKSNPRFANADVKIDRAVELPNDKNWSIYLIKINGNPLIIYSNGSYFSTNMMSLPEGKPLDDLITPKFDTSNYKDSHLVAGDKNAKNKVAIFSDPICPFCIRSIPNIYAEIKANPKNTALYYYHLPLASIHPSAVVISRAMIVASQKGIKDVIPRIYRDGLFKADSTEKEVLEIFNQALGTSITAEEINADSITSELQADIKLATQLLVNSTPTMYLNGKKDITLAKYKKELN
jgi:hypothetical protein